MIPITTASPSVRGTKIQWYMAVIANWALDQSISEVINTFNHNPM